MSTAEAHVPPQNLEAEESVLGAMMVSEAAMTPVILDVRLADDDFYRERHRLVFRAIKRLYERSEPVDALTVSELLTQQGELDEAGGSDAVSQLASTVPVPGNAGHYARIVKQNALLRRLLDASHTIQKSVHEREGEPRDLVERAERLLFKVAHEEQVEDFRVLDGDPRARGRPARGARRRASARSPGPRRASATSTRSPAASSRAT